MRCALLVLAAACGGPQIAEHAHNTDLTKVLPSTLEASRPRTGDPRQIHVRVWADAAVRALPRWKEDINDEIDYAGQLLQPMLGIRLTVDKISDWTRTGDPHEALAQLADVDDGKDVTWVIGFIGAGDVASKAMSELGDARALGHLVVVRGWAEKPETDALAVRLPELTQAQRTELLNAHRRHKQTVVLLHQLGVTLGAIAEADEAWIQHPLYSPKQAGFSDRNRELMQITIDQRISGGTDQTIAHDLLEAIEKSEWGGWIAPAHDELVAMLKNVVDAAKAGKTASDVPAAAYEQFDRIRELRKRDAKEALAELDNLLTAYPGNATMHELKCEIMLDKPGPSDKATRSVCERVSQLAPGDPSPHFAVGEALAKANDIAGAHAELAQAAGKIGNLKLGQEAAWHRLVGIYLSMGALTWTEDALTAAKLDKDPAAAEVAQARARYGVPRGAKFVKPEAEPALVAAVRAALPLIYASKFGDAEKALATAEKKWPGAPGLAAARCDLAYRQRQIDAARAACQRALAADPDDSWALYLGGVIAVNDGNNKLAIDRLKHAITVDAELGQAWRTLAQVYKRTENKTALEELGTGYQAKFGQTLPP